MEVLLRHYTAADINSIIELFRGTVHTVNKKDYTEAQLNAWAPQNIPAEKWNEKLLSHYTIVAECNGQLCGFGDIDTTGYFDHLFVHKDYQGCGVATKIVTAIETHALEQDNKRITVNVSITAKPFFLKQGYSIVKEQSVVHNGETFTNYAMEKLML